jgi:hypothetical protein
MARTVRDTALSTAAPVCASHRARSLIGGCSSKGCISGTAAAPPAAAGSHAGATTAGSTTRRSLGWPTTCRTPTNSRLLAGAARGPGLVGQPGADRAGLPAPANGPYTVARALADYLVDFRRRGARGAEAIESVVRRNVLPVLGDMLVRKLTTRQLLDWHRSIAERPRFRRSRPGGEPKFAAFDPSDPEAVRRRRASANRVLTYLKAAPTMLGATAACPVTTPGAG